MKFLLIAMPAILDGGWRARVPYMILKVGQPKIISAHISEQTKLIWFFLSQNMQNQHKLAKRKKITFKHWGCVEQPIAR
jgi:hypothetical protein